MIKKVSECNLSYEEKINLLNDKIKQESIKYKETNSIYVKRRLESIKLGLEFQVKYNQFQRRKK